MYTYNGDSMNNKDVIVYVENISDIGKITENTKYINISISNVDMDVIDYFFLHGQNFSYSDTINDKNGFLYVDYLTFKDGETIISNIIDRMPNNLNKLEMIRYIYISLGKILHEDINVIEDKNEIVSFESTSIVSNVWSSIVNNKINDVSVCKLFMYLCSRIGINSELISTSVKGNIANKVYLDNSFLIVDLFNDIYNIQGGFSTKYFDKYNDDRDMDIKLSYIKDNYTQYYIEKLLKKFDYTEEDAVYKILSLSVDILDIRDIGTVELYKIYRSIFDKYCPNYDIKINNFYIFNNSRGREHFIVINYNDKYYSFNYIKNCFVDVGYKMLFDNLNNRRIGLYDGEEFCSMEKGLVL